MSYTIRKRIAISLGIRFALIVLGTGVALYSLYRVAWSTENVAYVVKEIELFSELELTIEKSLTPVNDYLITAQKDQKIDFDRRAGRLEELFAVGSRLSSLDDKKRLLLNQSNESYQRLRKLAEEIFALPYPIGNARGQLLMERFNAMGEKIVLGLDEYRPAHQRELDSLWKETVNAKRQGFIILLGSGGAVVALSLVLGLKLTRSVIEPIQLLESGTERIAAGDWDHRVDVRTGDELETLAERFNGMAIKLGGLYRSLEEEVAGRGREITVQLNDLVALLETSAEVSATLKVESLLSLIAERLVHTVKATYCRIALIEADHPDPITRMAYPIRVIDWDPGIGKTLETKSLPSLRKALETGRYVILSPREINLPELALERKQLFTPDTQSALIYPLVLGNRPQGVIILGDARSWEREPFSKNKVMLCQTMVNQAVVAIANAKNYAGLQDMFFATVSAMASAIDAKSSWTRGHSDRVTDYAVSIGKEMGLEPARVDHLRLGCLLHDIGKIGTLEAILDKPGRLTDEELIIMKQHSIRGEEILKPIRQFNPILPIIRNHHERYDGTGYPDGLRGEEIPLLARIAAVADTFDSMTADRPYRKAPGRENAIAEIRKYSGVQFDPVIASVFLTLLSRGVH